MRALPLVLAVAAISIPHAVSACRIHRPPATYLEQGYQSGQFETVAIAEVTAIGSTGDWEANAHASTARARILSTPIGPEKVGSFEFSYNALISSCGWPLPLEAEIGERVVLYISRDAEGDAIVYYALDLEDALRIDKRLLTLLAEPFETLDLRNSD